jgi:nicotinamidase-related amidase
MGGFPMRGFLVRSLGLVLIIVSPAAVVAEDAPTLKLKLRTQVEPFKGSGQFREVTLPAEFKPNETAILICDMWDKHWCPSATKRCGAIAEKMEPVLQAARAKGVLIVHAPSECMGFYKDTPQRRKLAELTKLPPPKDKDIPEPPLPIDASDGGCDDDNPPKSFRAWTRQHPVLSIGPDDVISDDGREIYSYFQQRGIKNLLLMGVHTNMCVLGRSFGIRQMTRWGINCILVRDLTDTMYNPKKAPFVTHDEGTELVVKHIEKYWCPTVGSGDLLPAK